VNITPGTPMRQLKQFFILNLLPYSPKIRCVLEVGRASTRYDTNCSGRWYKCPSQDRGRYQIHHIHARHFQPRTKLIPQSRPRQSILASTQSSRTTYIMCTPRITFRTFVITNRYSVLPMENNQHRHDFHIYDVGINKCVSLDSIISHVIDGR